MRVCMRVFLGVKTLRTDTSAAGSSAERSGLISISSCQSVRLWNTGPSHGKVDCCACVIA